MNRQLRDLSLAFAAGAVGALANSIAVWLAGDHGLTAALGLKVAPELTAAWLYPRLVWGGIWGLLLVLPILERVLQVTKAFVIIADDVDGEALATLVVNKLRGTINVLAEHFALLPVPHSMQAPQSHDFG